MSFLPNLTPPPTPPSRSDPPPLFITRADAFVDWLGLFAQEMTQFADWDDSIFMTRNSAGEYPVPSGGSLVFAGTQANVAQMWLHNDSGGPGAAARFLATTGLPNVFGYHQVENASGTPRWLFTVGSAVTGGVRWDVPSFQIANPAGVSLLSINASSGQLNGNVRAAFVSPNVGSSGAVVIRDAVGNPGAAFLQATANDGSTQYSFLRFNLGTVNVGGNICPDNDAVQTVGLGGARWGEVYCVNPAINTSDEREKTWRGGLTPDELAAARAIVAELGFYQWNDSIIAKGPDGARYHFGARAQRVWAIMAAHGLVGPIDAEGNPPADVPYAFLCWDEWDDEHRAETEMVRRVDVQERVTLSDDVFGPDGTPARTVELVEVEHFEQVATGEQILVRAAGARFGLRTEQLTLFLLAAMEQRLAAIEAA